MPRSSPCAAPDDGTREVLDRRLAEILARMLVRQMRLEWTDHERADDPSVAETPSTSEARSR
jgi:hypothetical protein